MLKSYNVWNCPTWWRIIFNRIPIPVQKKNSNASSHFTVVVVVQLLSHLFATPWTAACQSSLSITISQSSLKLMSIELVMPSNHLFLCRPPLFLPSIFSSIRVFSNELGLCNRWPKYWSFRFSISLSSEYSGLISFGIYWLDLLAVQRTSLNDNLKTSILQHSAFLMVQLLYLYMTAGKTIALIIWTFVSKVMSLLFNMMSRLVIAFLPRSKRLLISWLQSLSAVILEPKKVKSVSVSIVSPSICHEMMGPDAISSFAECWVLNQLFHSPLSLSSRDSLLFFAFCRKGGVICISEVIDISPGNLDSSLCFIQPGISHDILCM